MKTIVEMLDSLPKEKISMPENYIPKQDKYTGYITIAELYKPQMKYSSYKRYLQQLIEEEKLNDVYGKS